MAMTCSQTSQPLPLHQDSLQAHWLQTLGDCAQQGTGKLWIPVRLRLTPKGVETMLTYFRGGISPSSALFLGIQAADIRAGWETYDVLIRAQEQNDELALKRRGSVEIDVLIAASHQVELWKEPPEGPSIIQIVDVGLARPLNTFVPLGFGFPGNDPESAPEHDQENCHDNGPDKDESDAHLKDAKAIIAIIDDGIAFANPRFRLSDQETRIEYFYAMETTKRDRNTNDFQASWLDKKKIDSWLHAHGNDEEMIYRQAGLLDPAVDRRQPLWLSRTHGTHVLDIAAGYDIQDPDAAAKARQFPIVAVQLPTLLVEDTSGSYIEPDLRMALTKIEAMARALSRRIARQQGRDEDTLLPLIVNFSFGVFAGPKDGSSLIARHIRNFIQAYRRGKATPPCHVVLPAGNGFQARTVGRLDLPVGGEETIEWRILPDDKTASFLHIWLPKRPAGGGQQLSITLISPVGQPKEILSSQIGHYVDWTCDGTPYARIYHREAHLAPPDDNGSYQGETREHILLALRPTATDCDEPHLSPAGLWQVRIKNSGGPSPLRVDITAQRDDTMGRRWRRGRQSYLESPCYQRYDPVTGRFIVDDDPHCLPIRREGSLNAYTASAEPVVVGGYRWSDGKAADYTASGPVISGRVGPDLAAASEISPSHLGRLASGTYANAVRMLRGTSVAAPALVRALAEEIASNGDLESLKDRLLTREGAPIDGPHGTYAPLPPKDRRRLGDGRLEPPDRPPHRRRIES